MHGVVDPVEYAVEAVYTSDPGERPNAGLESTTIWPKVKFRVAPDDTVYVQAIGYDYEGGGMSPGTGSRGRRIPNSG